MLARRAVTDTPLRMGRLPVAAAVCLIALALGAQARAEAASPRVAYVSGSSSSEVWLASAGGNEARRLGPGSDPLLAPDGNSVAASLFGASADTEPGPAVGIYSALGAPVADFLDLETAISQPLAWSPDSRYLAVYRRSTVIPFLASGSGLDVIDAQTGAVASIAEGVISGASFARDGSDRLVFALSHSESPSAAVNLYLSGPVGGGLTRLTSDGRSLNPLWGPRSIAYDRERLRRNDFPVYQIWLHSPSGAQTRRLTNIRVRALVAGLVPLAFSAGGSRLLAEFEGEDTSEAWAVNASSGRARRVTVRGRSVMGAGISRDGGSLLVDENAFDGVPPARVRIALVPFAGGRSKLIVAHGAQASWNG